MKKSVDFIGVGTGPFNLSIAALSHQIEELDCLFFDEHPHFSWHPGMLVPDCHMQTVFLKDLVSAGEAQKVLSLPYKQTTYSIP